MSKPSPLAEISRGVALGAVRNFADTFNWIAKFCYYLVGQSGALEIVESEPDRPVLKLVGFESADDNAVPQKKDGALKWVVTSSGGYTIKVIGTDGSYAMVGDPSATEYKTLSFASAQDSNVVVTVSGSGGDAVVTLANYWT